MEAQMTDKTNELIACFKRNIAMHENGPVFTTDIFSENEKSCHHSYINGLKRGLEIVEMTGYDHAAAELRWIPIRSADDLPKENGYYLATCGSVGIDPDDTTSHELNWFGGKWYLPSDEMIEMDGVIAWMKKPKPYTEPADKIAEVGEREGVDGL
jgi:hypothetical protein